MDQRLAPSIRLQSERPEIQVRRQPKISAPDTNVTFRRYRDTCV